MHIDPKIADNVDENQRAVIAQYDLEVRDSAGHFEVSDPVIRATMPRTSKVGRYSGGNLDLVLSEAVQRRQDYVARNGAPKAARTRKGAVQAAPAAPAPSQEEHAAPSEIVDAELDETGRRERAPRRTREPAVRKDNRYLRMARVIAANLDITAETLAGSAGISVANASYDGLGSWRAYVNQLISDGQVAPASGLSSYSIKGTSVYVRSAPVFSAEPEITAEALSRRLDKMSPAVAAWCVTAWQAINQVLGERKWLVAPGTPAQAAKKARAPRGKAKKEEV